MTLPKASQAALEEIVTRTDPGILGVVLSGSAGRGIATEWSDVDVYLVLTEEAYQGRQTQRSAAVDEIPITLEALESPAPLGTDAWWYRWSFAWALVLRDETRGRLEAALLRTSTLTGQEQRDVLLDRLDGMGNYLYRALKSLREGRSLEQRLDTSEGVPWGLDVLFALEGRIRPYNKYLPWELREHPLAAPVAEPATFLSRLAQMLDGDTAQLMWLWDSLRPACEAFDDGWGSPDSVGILDDWEHHFVVLRPLLASHS